MTALRTAQLEKSTISHLFFWFTHRYTTDPQAPPGYVTSNETCHVLLRHVTFCLPGIREVQILEQNAVYMLFADIHIFVQRKFTCSRENVEKNDQILYIIFMSARPFILRMNVLFSNCEIVWRKSMG